MPSRFKKKWKKLALGTLGALIVAVVLIYISLGTIVRSGISSVGPKLTKTDIDIGAVTLSPFTGRTEIHSFTVGNPKGFEAAFAVRFDDFSIHLDPSSVFGETVKIKTVRIKKPEITYETNRSGNNLKTIQKNISRFSASSSKNEGGKAKKFIIDDLFIEDPILYWRSGVTGGKPIELRPGDIHLKDMGKSQGGAGIETVVSKVTGSLLGTVQSAVTSGAKELGKAVKSGADEVKSGLKKLFE